MLGHTTSSIRIRGARARKEVLRALGREDARRVRRQPYERRLAMWAGRSGGADRRAPAKPTSPVQKKSADLTPCKTCGA
jgi:hypothetical protein